jgi:hypothetical protein
MQGRTTLAATSGSKCFDIGFGMAGRASSHRDSKNYKWQRISASGTLPLGISANIKQSRIDVDRHTILDCIWPRNRLQKITGFSA